MGGGGGGVVGGGIDRVPMPKLEAAPALPPCTPSHAGPSGYPSGQDLLALDQCTPVNHGSLIQSWQRLLPQ